MIFRFPVLSQEMIHEPLFYMSCKQRARSQGIKEMLKFKPGTLEINAV